MKACACELAMEVAPFLRKICFEVDVLCAASARVRDFYCWRVRFFLLGRMVDPPNKQQKGASSWP